MKKILFIALVLFSACSAKKQAVISETSINAQAELEITINLDERISFIAKNNSGETMFLLQPQRLKIEKHNNDSWKKLRILPCPCDAPCNAPPEYHELKINDIFSLEWNKMESWCGTERVNHIRNTEKKMVEAGTYRIEFRYRLSDKEVKLIYKEFTIK